MLRLADPPSDAPLGAGRAYPDDADPRLLYLPPAGVTVSHEANGAPRLGLARFRGDDGAAGAVFSLELALMRAEPPAVDDWRFRALPFDAARARVRGLAAVGGEMTPLSAWVEAKPMGATLFRDRLLLDPASVQRLDAMLDPAGAGAIEVEVEARFTGRTDPLEALAKIQLDLLAPLLRTHVPDLFTPAGAPLDAVEAAMLSLPGGAAFAFVLPGEAPVFDDVRLRLTLANLIAADLCAPASDDAWSPRFAWQAPESGGRSWDLSVAGVAQERWTAAWSLTDFLGTLDPALRAGLFASARIEPFGAAEVLVLARDAIDPRAVRRVQLDVTHIGMGGVPRERSLVYPGAATVERLQARFPATGGVQLSATIAATLAAAPDDPDGLPRRVAAAALAPEGPVIAWSLADAGVATLALAADPSLFHDADTLTVTAFRSDRALARVELSADQPEATLAWAAADTASAVQGIARRGPREAIVFAVAPDALPRLDAALLAPDAPDLIRVALLADPDLLLATVDVEDGAGHAQSFRLDAGVTVEWRSWRRSRLDPPSYRWRVRFVARDADGRAGPLAEGPWTGADGATLLVSRAVAVPA